MSRWLRMGVVLIALGSVLGCGGSSSSSGGGTNNSATVNVGVMNGSYAFLLRGFDPTGKPMAMVGSLTFDGKGNVTGGSADVNDNFVVSSSSGTALTGTYTLDATFRGSISLTNTFGSLAHPLAFAFAMKANGTSGNIMSLDTNPFTTSGTIQQQTTAAFSLANLASSYAFELDGFQVASNVNKRESTIGRFSVNASGVASNGLLDQSVAGLGATLANNSFSGQFNGSGPNSAGRSTLQLIVNNTTQSYIYYVASASKLFLIESDPSSSSNTIQAGMAIQQTVPSTAATGGSVFSLAGVDSGNDVAAIGQLVISTSANLTWDANDNGTFCQGGTASGQAVQYSSGTGSASGRGTISVFGSCSMIPPGGTASTSSGGGSSLGLFDSAVFYLTGPGQGFVLDASAGTSNKALAGELQAQNGTGAFAAGTLSASMIVRAAASGGTVSVTNNGSTTSANNIGAVTGVLALSAPNNFNLIYDQRTVGQPDAVNKEDTAVNFSNISAAVGRGTLTIPPPSGLANPVTAVIYIIGPNQFVFVDETPTPAGVANPIPSPVVFSFDPQ